ncbi:hypothetical protein GCM10025867_46570 (plasmid) [Frondihabitans sucicola]|uniref:Uncharacterized protein n=1 Tax=Frondihabitans sucicola TaxID=1268041 RepID=A0ABM8GVB6_9MICO|nr:hypothetical protein [Frondihabitans sucicola]BDZ52416.1 hypothetical protein GCM10025867_46570 [Frondihabitans sucicola]
MSKFDVIGVGDESSPSAQVAVGRFDSEPDAYSAILGRPGVAEAIAAGRAPSTRYIVMEFLDEDDELPYATWVLANDGRMLRRDI